MAICVGMISSAIAETYMALAKQDIYAIMDKSHIEAWTRLYKKHRLIIKALWDSLQENNDTTLQSQLKDTLLNSIFAETPGQQKQLVHSIRNMTKKDCEEFAFNMNDFLKAMLNKLILNKSNPPKVQEGVPLELIFLLKVHVCCWMEYGEHFHIIYRKARQGNYNAIEKLLRIDRIILHDKFIRLYFFIAKKKMFHKLKIAYDNPYKNLFKTWKVKSLICGFISAFFEYVGKESIEPTQIRKLFDTIAFEFDDKPEDKDLQDKYDAFRKSVKRHHKFWLPFIKSISKPDINLPNQNT